MNTPHIEFFHDVICSFCFPMSYRMRQLAQEMPTLQITHRSFALVKQESDFTRMFGSRERAKGEILKHWAHANQLDEQQRFNIAGMQQQSFPFPLSMKPLWAAKAAYMVGSDSAYWDAFDALQTAFFSHSQNIEQDDIIAQAISSTGIDLAAWQAHFASDAVKHAVQEDLQLAERYGLNGAPALVINGKETLVGAVSLQRVKTALNRA